MPNTYVALRTETVATATNSVTFSLSGISGYTDLVLVINNTHSTNAVDGWFRLNGDTGSNYSRTNLNGDGTSATSGRNSNVAFGYGILVLTTPSTNILQFMNYANTTTNKTVLMRSNNAGSGGYVQATVDLWRNTAAITSIEIGCVSGNFAVGSTFSLYGIANADQGAAKATGGIITEDSQYWYHTFGASGTFTPKQALTCDYLVVAGGGGSYVQGGGAGGYRTSVGTSGGNSSAESALSLASSTAYTITVGAGGAGGGTGGQASASSIAGSGLTTITSTGGGGATGGDNGANGGSGGGAFNSGTAGTGTANQGTAGGASAFATSGGGGGGASSAGGAAASTVGGNGGNGLSSSITGTSVARAGGGAGYGTVTNGTAATGGVGANTDGGTNTGQGAGGTSGAGKTGGSGIVIIRYSK